MILRNISIILILFTVLGCSTKKNTWLSRNYHNLTAYYNVYYNGREAFRNGDKAINEGYRNNYTNLLPVFESSDPEAAAIATADMDRAIEKGQKLIKKHSITAKPQKRSRNNAYAAEFYSKKEFNAWVDDAYILIGKAHVYKHEHSLAIRTLQQVVRDFPDEETMYEALIWQARAYTDRGDYVGALAALESYDLGGNAPTELYADYMAVYANLLIAQEKYIDAIPYLSNALADERSKHKRLRYSYILGQLYLLNNQRQEAADAFGYVAKASTDYEMTFNAKVNRASIIYNNADIADVKKQLHKLRRDKKNKDYLDRIYFAFGKVALQENDEKEALLNFKRSIGASTDNDHQKGLSYRETGELYYAQMDYVNAFFYYDSALTVIDEEYKQMEQLKEKHYGLSGLVDHLLTVEREDSLQNLADMSEPVLYAYLDEIIADKEAQQERLKKQEAEESMSDAFFYQNTNTNNSYGQSGKWYFYNQTSKSMGKMEFEKRWGKRKLEDNWRRKDKSKMEESTDNNDPFALPDDPFGTEEGTTENAEETAKTDEKKSARRTSEDVPTREQLMADIPLSEEQRRVSDEKIQTALLEQGLVFMDRLQNYPKAIEALEELLSRYPKASTRDEALIALYNAYRLHGDTNGMASAQKRIENEFPEHRFVAFLNDPDYLKKVQDKKQKEAAAYEQTYSNFLFGHFTEVIDAATLAVDSSEESTEHRRSKYLLLRGLSYAKTGHIEPFKKDLNTIIDEDKEGEEAALAKTLLKHLKEGKTPVQGTLFAAAPGRDKVSETTDRDTSTPKQEAEYVYVENEPYQLIVMGIDENLMNRAIYNVADYNFSRYLLHDFEIQEKRLLDGTAAISVTGFSNRVEAMDYFYGLRENPHFFGFEKINDKMLIISESNNNKFFLSGLVKDYLVFFDKYYLQHVSSDELKKVSMVDTTQQIATPLDTLKSPLTYAEKETQQITQEAKEAGNEKQIGEAVGATEKVVSAEAEKAETKPISQEKEVKEEATAPVTALEKAAEEEKPDTTNIETEATAPSSIFTNIPEERHLVVLIIRKTRIDYNKVQRNFAAHTRNNYGDDYKVQLMEFGSAYRMVQIEGFKNAQSANDYLDGMAQYPYLTRDLSRTTHYIWVISESNMKKLTETNKLEEYDNFFKANY
ncbi:MULTISPECIES: tetratricopeptide repeat protein [unclassified Carboxylicivirga]|uniref:type IX secretion system periplasmic lipoprotein PorW/SprE n=1 Tax=Carboxylicivirga TaxID=1628153 RepID=UPI003D352F38